jgi:hypothetical protein
MVAAGRRLLRMQAQTRIQAPLRRALLLAAFVASASGVADAQTVCDQLLPIGLVPPQGGFAFGCDHQYHVPAGPGSSAYYRWLAFPTCPDGPCAGLTDPQLFVCAATSGYSCCISDSVPLIAGIYAGPLRLGLDQRIANDTDTRVGICYSDYAGNGSRLGNVLLIQPTGTGATQAHVAGFLRMFLSGPAGAFGLIPIEFVDQPTPVRGTSWGRAKILYR